MRDTIGTESVGGDWPLSVVLTVAAIFLLAAAAYLWVAS